MNKARFVAIAKEMYDFCMDSDLRVVKVLHANTERPNAMLAQVNIDVKYVNELTDEHRVLSFDECLENDDAMNHIFSYTIAEMSERDD